MLRRTLTALAPVLFALPLLLTPTSQLYADGDSMSHTYAGSECKFVETIWDDMGQMPLRGYAMEGQEMAAGHVVYQSRLGIGNNASRMGTPNGDYNMFVSCPLPSVDMGDQVIVAVIDGTVFDDVTCRIQTCRTGIGIGAAGSGACTGGDSVSTSAAITPAGATANTGVAQGANYITQNSDFLVLDAPLQPMAPSTPSASFGLRTTQTPNIADGAIASNLLCTLPEKDDESPTAPAIREQTPPNLPLSEQGISYIQSYYVEY